MGSDVVDKNYLKPKVTPIGRAVLIDEVCGMVDSYTGDEFEFLEGRQGEVRDAVRYVLGVLPEVVCSKIVVSNRCPCLADDAVEEVGEEFSGLRENLCVETTMILYRDYIEEVGEKIKSFCEGRPVPKKWGMMSMERTMKDGDFLWGQKFVRFWRKNIEMSGDEQFRRLILLYFPKSWRDTYEMREQLDCPYDWANMEDFKIADVLMGLKKMFDPSVRRWWMGGFYNWKAADGGKWGESFYTYWRKNVEGAGKDEKFRERIWPHFSESWRRNYEMQEECPYDWGKMKDFEIADVLMGLEKASDPSKNQWWMGSLHQWKFVKGGKWGSSFYAYWRANVEVKGKDEKFRERISVYFPESWRKNYEMQELCPYEWGKMENSEIAKVLVDLKRTRSPDCNRWGLGGIQFWNDEHGGRWGASFYNYWRRQVEGAGTDEKFRERIWPHFPESWRKNYEMQEACPYEWGKMENPEIANVLVGLEKKNDPSVCKWGMGSLGQWKVVKGGRWGISFYNYWRRNVEGKGEDEKFRDRILSCLPDSWRKNYKMSGYSISFVESTDESRAKVVRCDDAEDLYVLADVEGNQEAFDKLVALVLEANFYISKDLVERAIHLYWGVVPIIQFCVRYACVEEFFLKKKFVDVEHLDSSNRGHAIFSCPSDVEVRDGLPPDFEFLLEGVTEELGMTDDEISGLLALMSEGATLADIAAGKDGGFDEMQAVAADLQSWLAERVDEGYLG